MTVSEQGPGHRPPLPYAETTDDAYSATAARSFEPLEVGKGTVVLRGPCPRCLAVIDIPVVSGIFKSSRSLGGWLHGSAPGPADPSYVEPMICTCAEDHPARPAGRSGCGAYWTLTITPAAR